MDEVRWAKRSKIVSVESDGEIANVRRLLIDGGFDAMYESGTTAPRSYSWQRPDVVGWIWKT